MPPVSQHLAYLKKSATIRLYLAGAIAIVVGIFLAYPGIASWIETTRAIATLDQSIGSTQQLLSGTRDTYRALKEDYAETAVRDAAAIEVILPRSAQETEIVRQIETATTAIAATGQLELRSIRFNNITRQQDSAYDTIPFRVSINGTQETFEALLHFFEGSGSLDASEPLRLFRVEDVSVTINEHIDPRLGRGPIDAELTIHAYAFRPQYTSDRAQ